MNEVVITVAVRRANSEQCLIQVVRTGTGDDFVESRADSIQQAVEDAAQRLITVCGGQDILGATGGTTQ